MNICLQEYLSISPSLISYEDGGDTSSVSHDDMFSPLCSRSVSPSVFSDEEERRSKMQTSRTPVARDHNTAPKLLYLTGHRLQGALAAMLLHITPLHTAHLRTKLWKLGTRGPVPFDLTSVVALRTAPRRRSRRSLATDAPRSQSLSEWR